VARNDVPQDDAHVNDVTPRGGIQAFHAHFSAAFIE
jgi:hypothetical protein